MTNTQAKVQNYQALLTASGERPSPPLWGRVKPLTIAVLIPQALELAPDARGLHPDHLPLWVPEQQAPAGGLPFPADPAAALSRDHAPVWERLWSLISRFEQAAVPADVATALHLELRARADPRIRGALVPLVDPAEPLQAALDRAFPGGLDLDEHAVFFAPLWKLEVPPARSTDPQPVDRRQAALARLPLLAGDAMTPELAHELAELVTGSLPTLNGDTPKWH